MKFVLKPSLEQRALVRITAAVWNHESIRTLVANSKVSFNRLVWNEYENGDMWKSVENKAMESVSKLPLPEILKTKVEDVIKPIGLEMLKWKEFHEDFFQGSSVDLCCILKNLFWNLQGTVDGKKTAQALIERNCLHGTKAYELACVYCLEGCIPSLWNNVRQCGTNLDSEQSNELDRNEVVIYWTRAMKGASGKIIRKGRDRRRCTPLQCAFEYAAFYNHKTAAQYFLKQMSAKEREGSLEICTKYAVIRCFESESRPGFGLDDGIHHFVPSELITETVCFLFSELNEQQQIKLFQEFPYHVLSRFCVWPWQGYFLDIAKHTCEFLAGQRFYEILEKINKKTLCGYRDFNYQELFQIFWHMGSATQQKYLRDRSYNRCLTQDLFAVGDKEMIKLVWRDGTREEKHRFIFANGGKFLVEDLIRDDKWDLLEFFVREFIASRNSNMQYAKFVTGNSWWKSFWSQEPGTELKRDRYLQLLDLVANDSTD